MVASVSFAGLFALYLLIKLKVKPFHVEVEPVDMRVLGVNIFPLFILMIRLLLDKVKKNMVTKEVCWF